MNIKLNIGTEVMKKNSHSGNENSISKQKVQSKAQSRQQNNEDRVLWLEDKVDVLELADDDEYKT